jgi:hypothetical protein
LEVLTMLNNEALAALLKSKPWLIGTLTGAAVGAPVGLFKSDEGEGTSGALGGALAGAGIGTAAGMGVDAIRRLLGTTGMGMAVGGAAGLGGGILGASKLSPWIRKRLMNQAEVEPEMEMPKEANMDEAEDQVVEGDEQTKQAELEKVAVARINSFDYGLELFCHENGINKQALAEAVGFESADQMAPGIIECMTANEQAE